MQRIRSRIASWLEDLAIWVRPIPSGNVRLASAPVADGVNIRIQYDELRHDVGLDLADAERFHDCLGDSLLLAKLGLPAAKGGV